MVNVKKTLRNAATVSCFCLFFYAAGYHNVKQPLLRIERESGIEKAVEHAELFMKNYGKRWYLRPILFPGKVAAHDYLLKHNYKNNKF